MVDKMEKYHNMFLQNNHLLIKNDYGQTKIFADDISMGQLKPFLKK